MTGFTGATFLLALTFCISCAEESNNANIELFYRSKTLNLTWGSSVQLSSEALYHPERCGWVQVEWIHLLDPDRYDDGSYDPRQHIKLTDPRKYVTTVNETIVAESKRRRRVVTEIFRMTPKDDGAYQCWAKCETGEEEKGHLIKISVTE